jgi:hypothetical protein
MIVSTVFAEAPEDSSKIMKLFGYSLIFDRPKFLEELWNGISLIAKGISQVLGSFSIF